MSKAPSDMYFESVVRPEQNNRFLLDSLCERFTYHSREDWIDRLTRGLVTLNGQVATVESIAHTDDKVVYHVENYTEPEVPTDFTTVFEDDEFMVVAKPAGTPVHHTGHIFYNTFAAIVRRATDCDTATPMHRLDRDTGGLMLFAKYAESAARFQKNLDRILLRKFYLAVVEGEFPEGEMHCEFPLREVDDDPIRLRMHHVEGGKPCHTVFKRIAVLPGSSGSGTNGSSDCGSNSGSNGSSGSSKNTRTLVEAELITGRKHQIRAHLAELGFPIVGDRLYGHGGVYYEKMARGGGLTEEDFQVLGAHSQMLYAYKAEIQLPYWREPRTFESHDFPDEMKRVVEPVIGNLLSCSL
ncbi:MAG: RluA family pseudouridine synthase [Fibrobacter sp.]|nr:RluA family pseudouridine synthase [Fibrobacter sp.]